MIIVFSCEGVTGVVQLDENGDREIDFALWDMTDTDSGVYQVFHADLYY